MPTDIPSGGASSEGPGLVHFEGPWTPEEIARLERAAGVAETAGLPALPQDVGRPWVATKHVFRSFALCMASRARVTHTVTARDAAALAAQVEAFTNGDAAAVRSVFQLVYQSEATGPMDGEALRELLRQARDKNHRLAVTGVLLYKAGGFLQVLEGDEETVRALYATICEDLRHEAVETLLTTGIERRVFPGWSMGLEDLEHGEDAIPPDEPGVTSFLETGHLPAGREPLPDLAEALEQFKERR
jgi:hypothetical protein